MGQTKEFTLKVERHMDAVNVEILEEGEEYAKVTSSDLDTALRYAIPYVASACAELA